MLIRTYTPADAGTLLALWNDAGVKAGFAPLDAAEFDRLFLNHPDFSPELTFLLEHDGQVLGFVNGCTGDHIPRGDVRGYVTVLLLKEAADTAENTGVLLDVLEDSFRKLGRSQSAVTFFNPIRLPWILPGTPGHRHNNAPGIALDLPLHRRMLDLGYQEAARERAMHLDLSEYEVPAWVEEKATKMEKEGYTVALYDPNVHTGLREMVDTLGNPLWSEEIPAAGRDSLTLLVGLCGNTCAGFTGPVWPEESGRGYFAGIGVAPQFERHGLGTLLFHRLLQAEKAAGAAYMSLFTGENNPAGDIYLNAGFRTRRTFGVMIKEL